MVDYFEDELLEQTVKGSILGAVLKVPRAPSHGRSAHEFAEWLLYGDAPRSHAGQRYQPACSATASGLSGLNEARLSRKALTLLPLRQRPELR